MSWFKRGASTESGNTPSASPSVRPEGRAVPPWSDRLTAYDIEDEASYPESLTAIAAAHGHDEIPEYGAEIVDARAAVLRNPGKSDEPDAIGVWVDGEHFVGHLPPDVATRYAGHLDALEAGTYLEVPARVWVAAVTDWDYDVNANVQRPWGRVTVELPELTD